jgi:hypothetical protein
MLSSWHFEVDNFTNFPTVINLNNFENVTKSLKNITKFTVYWYLTELHFFINRNLNNHNRRDMKLLLNTYI